MKVGDGDGGKSNSAYTHEHWGHAQRLIDSQSLPLSPGWVILEAHSCSPDARNDIYSHDKYRAMQH